MFENIKEYINLRLKHARFSFAERMALTSANFTATIIFVALFSLMFLFLSLGLGFYLGEKYNSFGTGFFIVGLIYLAVLLILVIFKRFLIINPIRNKVLFNFLNAKKNEEEVEQ